MNYSLQLLLWICEVIGGRIVLVVVVVRLLYILLLHSHYQACGPAVATITLLVVRGGVLGGKPFFSWLLKMLRTRQGPGNQPWPCCLSTAPPALPWSKRSHWIIWIAGSSSPFEWWSALFHTVPWWCWVFRESSTWGVPPTVCPCTFWQHWWKRGRMMNKTINIHHWGISYWSANTSINTIFLSGECSIQWAFRLKRPAIINNALLLRNHLLLITRYRKL